MQKQKFPSHSIIFVLLVNVFITASAWAGQFLSGTVFVKGENIYLNAMISPNSEPVTIRIAPRTEVVKDVLNKLDTGDFLSGGFEMDAANKLYWLDTVESVGLRSLLGSWYEASTLFRFESFNRLRVVSSVNLIEGGVFSSRIHSKDFNYSLSPSAGERNWIAFLSDRQTTYFSTIENFGSNIRIKMYDTDSGKLIRVHNLSRLNSGSMTTSSSALMCQ